MIKCVCFRNMCMIIYVYNIHIYVLFVRFLHIIVKYWQSMHCTEEEHMILESFVLHISFIIVTMHPRDCIVPSWTPARGTSCNEDVTARCAALIFCRRELCPESTRNSPNTAEQHLARRDPRSTASVPRTTPNSAGNSRRRDFSDIKRGSFYSDFTSLAGQHLDPPGLRFRTCSALPRTFEPSTRQRGRELPASVERSRQPIAPNDPLRASDETRG